MKRHCIVTPDFPGPIKNGGVGTACLYLARYLVERGDHVSVLFTCPFETHDEEHWAEYFLQQHGIHFHGLSVVPKDAPPMIGLADFGRTSWQVSEWLEAQAVEFDFIHFQDWRGNGFIPLQRRRMLGTLSRSVMTVTMHSSTEWQLEGSHILPGCTPEYYLQEYVERYAVQHADVVISPSQHMFDYVMERGWLLPVEQKLIPYFIQAFEKLELPSTVPDELIFFGRLETRKGLELYTQTLRTLISRGHNLSQVKLTFLGKYGYTSVGHSKLYMSKITEEFQSYVREIEVLSDLDHYQCQHVLRSRPAAMILAPSLLDNYPFAVLECLQQGLRIIAARTGGIPEMIADASCLFDADPKGFADTLEMKLSTASAGTASTYQAHEIQRQWEELLTGHDAVAAARAIPMKSQPAPVAASIIGGSMETVRVKTKEPLVTICIPHFNHGVHLADLLHSLELQTEQAFTVIAVDDGSSNPADLEMFHSLASKYQTLGWQFVQQVNQGQGSARNHAASIAATPYLVFMDADNLAIPDMVGIFSRSIQGTGLDCLSCYFQAFETVDEFSEGKFRYYYTPVGPCIEAGVTDNVFGDTNFIVRRDVFHALGGFTESRISVEDWDFLARLSLEGYRMDVIPMVLFSYRYADDSLSRITSSYVNSRWITSLYSQGLSGWRQRMMMAVHSLSHHVRHLYHMHQHAEKKEKKLLKKISNLQKKLAAAEKRSQRLRDSVHHWNGRSWFKRAFHRLVVRH